MIKEPAVILIIMQQTINISPISFVGEILSVFKIDHTAPTKSKSFKQWKRSANPPGIASINKFVSPASQSANFDFCTLHLRQPSKERFEIDIWFVFLSRIRRL